MILDAAVAELTPTVGCAAACRFLGRSRAGHYRDQREPLHGPPLPRSIKPPRSLEDLERQAVLNVLHSERFCDAAPAQVWATLLDENIYMCSISTMYRILHANNEVRDRRNHACHPPHVKPELVASAPNQVWSWDITKLAGPQKWTWFHLYVIIDVFSRFVVGWHVATRETAALANAMIATAIDEQRVPADQLTLHADRGTSMTSKSVAFLLADLGVTRSHSRPHVSNDNPTPKHTSRPSNTGRCSRRTSPTSSKPEHSAPSSSSTTTTTTATQASRCTHPPTSTTAAPATSAAPARPPSTPPTNSTPTDSFANHPKHQPWPPTPGSTHPPTTNTHLSQTP